MYPKKPISVVKATKKRIALFAVFVAVIGFGVHGIPSKAAAQVSFEQLPESRVYNDFVVGPGKVDVEMDPGETRTFQMTITNRLGTTKTFNVTEEDFTGSTNPNQTIMLLGDDRGPYSLRDYIHFASTSIVISHANRARMDVTITVPKDAQPGGLYGSVIVGTASAPGEIKPGGAVPVSPIITRIGTLFFIRVRGPVNESGKLTQFLISGGKSIIFSPQTLDFDILFQNDGNVHLDPSGTIDITNMLGSPVGTLDVDPWFAMPNSLRFREVEWTPPFMFGRYVAHLSVHRGYGTTVDEATIVFWVIPWKILVSVLVGIIIIILIIRWIASHVTISSKKK